MDHSADSEKLLLPRGSLSSDETDLRLHLSAKRLDRKLVRCYQWLTAGVLLLLLGSNIAWYQVLQKSARSAHGEPHIRPHEHSQHPHKAQEPVKLPGQDMKYCKPASMALHTLTRLVLESGEPESILVPFEHDWPQLEEIDNIDGYRYADVHWKPSAWAPRE